MNDFSHLWHVYAFDSPKICSKSICLLKSLLSIQLFDRYCMHGVWYQHVFQCAFSGYHICKLLFTFAKLVWRFVWTLLRTFKPEVGVNFESHWLHSNGLVPLCAKECVLKELAFLKVASHCWHDLVFSLWDVMCISNSCLCKILMGTSYRCKMSHYQCQHAF